MTKAVLFQRNGQPVLFTDYAEYDTGTGYIVAENKEIGLDVYKRQILAFSRFFFYKKNLFLILPCSKNSSKDVDCIIVSSITHLNFDFQDLPK